MEITRLHISTGRLPELVYQRLREIVEGARGNVVALRASWFSKDRRAMVYINKLLDALCRSRGCQKINVSGGDMVRYVFTVDALKSITLEELEQLATLRPAGEHELRPKPRRGRPLSHESGGEKMPIISLNLPPEYIKAMDELIRQGRYRNRSEIVRTAIRQMLGRLTERS
jgi:hypothetical protein